MPYCQECGEQFDPKFPGLTHCYMCYCLLNQDKISKPQKAWLMKKMNKENKISINKDKEPGISDNELIEASFSDIIPQRLCGQGMGQSDHKYLWKSPFNSNPGEYYKAKIARFLFHKGDRKPSKISYIRKSVNSSI